MKTNLHEPKKQKAYFRYLRRIERAGKPAQTYNKGWRYRGGECAVRAARRIYWKHHIEDFYKPLSQCKVIE